MSITRLGTYPQIKGSPEKLPCTVATTENITLSGITVIDGYGALTDGDRVLVKNQNTPSENGIYIASESAWTRAVDMSLDDDVFTGVTVYINYGDINGGEYFLLTNANPIVLGTTGLTFVQSTAGGIFVEGAGCNSSVRVNSCNSAIGSYSFASGRDNNACCDYSIVLGGIYNTASGNYSFIGSGCCNLTNGNFSTLSGGYCNTSSGTYSFLGAGCLNIVCGESSFIGAGNQNCIQFGYSFIGSGRNNEILSTDSSSYLCNNTLCGSSSIVGGSFNRVSNELCETACQNILYEGNFIGAGNSNCIQSTVSGCYNYTGYNSIVGGSSNRICHITASNYTCTINNFIGSGHGSVIEGSCSSAIITGDGNCLYKSNFSFVGSGCLNCIGDSINDVTSDLSVIVTGERSRTEGIYNFIGSGCCNTSFNLSSIINGCANIANNTSFIGSGCGNVVNCCSAITSGINNCALQYSFIGSGSENYACASYSGIVSGSCNLICCNALSSIIVGGNCNTISSQYSFVSGGRFNTITGCASFALGQCNTVSGNYSGAFGTGLTADCACTSYFNNICTVGCTWSSCFVETSSCRFKENFQPIDSALMNVNRLQGVCYNRIGSCNVELGLVAEEVEKVYPQVVTYDGQGNPTGISYSRLTAILIESVKDLSKKLEMVEREVNCLKN
jgi:hypothetical protein